MPSRRTNRDGQRFKCPYPGCKRSFAELWRLKVHYRAPPDVRGSGKERGHGQELSNCPQCGAKLLPGKHHIQCSGTRPKRPEAVLKDGKAITSQNPNPLKQPRTAGSIAGYGVSGDAATSSVYLQNTGRIKSPSERGELGVLNGGAVQAPQSSQMQSKMPQCVRYVPMDSQVEKSWPSQGLIMSTQAPAAVCYQPQQQMPYHPHSGAPSTSTALPKSISSPASLKYTNTLIREGVPNNPRASHCNFQTDLAAPVWPLNQPFPFPAETMYASHVTPTYTVLAQAPCWERPAVPLHAVALQNPVNGVHSVPVTSQLEVVHQRSQPQTAESGFMSYDRSQLSSMTAVTHPPHIQSSMSTIPRDSHKGHHLPASISDSTNPTTQQHLTENAVGVSHQQYACIPPTHTQPSSAVETQDAAQVKMESGPGEFDPPGNAFAELPVPPSPPSPPPHDFVDMLFDFDKFDALDGMGNVHCDREMSTTSAHQGECIDDYDSMMDLPPVIDSVDVFKMFTHDSQGRPAMTSHLHQHHLVEGSADGFLGDDWGAGQHMHQCASNLDDQPQPLYSHKVGIASPPRA